MFSTQAADFCILFCKKTQIYVHYLSADFDQQKDTDFFPAKNSENIWLFDERNLRRNSGQEAKYLRSIFEQYLRLNVEHPLFLDHI